jgi:lipopolysaccharide transport protein LptA
MKAFATPIILLLFLLSPLFGASNVDIEADEFEYDGMKDIVTARGNVVVTQRDVVIKSDKGVYEKAIQQITLLDGVTMEKDGIYLTCQKAIANSLKNTVEALGTVNYTFNDIKGTAGKAFYDMNKNEIELTENPVAYQGRDLVKGERVIIDLDKNKVITRGKARVKLSVDKL